MRPLQGSVGDGRSREGGWKRGIQVWRTEGVLAMTAREACKEGSETCRGEYTNINITQKTGTTKANSITELMTWRKPYFN